MCKGEQKTTFICELDSSINSNKVRWYRLLKNTGTAGMVDLGDNHTTLFTRTENTLTSSLIVTYARISYTGYYWIRLTTDDVCNVSLTVLEIESM